MGSSLAGAAGLNAWIPLLALGLLARFTDIITLPAGWSWLTSDVSLWIIGALLVVEIVADKVPALDTVNDVIHTAIRPASGGIVFGAGASAEALKLDDPGALAGMNWTPVIVGVAIALGVHLLKAVARPVANMATAGLAAPVLSTAEDAASITMSVLALLVPILAVLVGLAVIAGLIWMVVRRIRHRRAKRATTQPV